MNEIHRRSFRPETLEVRAEGRTIIGTAVPFNTPTEIRDINGTYLEQFAPGAFARTLSERGASRVKLLLQHDMRQLPIGRALALREESGGLVAELRVSNTAEGDTALELVKDGTLDGLSIGFRPVTQSRNGDVVTRTEVKLAEISLTGFPAYDSARVEAVRSNQHNPADARALAIARAHLILIETRN